MLSDFRYAARRLLSQRSTTLIAIGTLALGIGANTTVLSFVNAVMFKPLNAKDPESLVWISPRSADDGRYRNWSYPDFKDFAQQAKSYAGVFAFGRVELSVGGEAPERVRGTAVSGNYFEVLGASMHAGRGFRDDEDRAAGERPAALLSYGFWKRRYGAGDDVVGRSIMLNGHAYTVVGIAAEGFNGTEMGESVDVWVPVAQFPLIVTDFNLLTQRRSSWLSVMGRLKANIAIESAQAESDAVFSRIQDANPVQGEDALRGADRRSIAVSKAVGGLDPPNRSQSAPIIGLIMVVPILVLLVACANLANLLIARALLRRKEFAVRTALGASRGRLVRLMLAECVLLALAASVVGSVGSTWLTAGIAYLGNVPADIRPILVPDATVFIATGIIAVFAGLLFGVVPALVATRQSLTPALKNEGITFRMGRERHRLRNVFVVGQIAVSLTLLITAGLFVGSLTKALRVDPGFNPRNAVAVSYDLSAQGYTAAQRPEFHRRVLDVIAATPGIRAATIADFIPLSSRSSSTAVAREGSTEQRERVEAYVTVATDGFFKTLEIPILRGRDFAVSDNGSATKVAVVNETLARRLWPDANPIGKRFQFSGGLHEIVGVVRDGRYHTLSEARPMGSFFVPAAQRDMGADVTLVVRSSMTPAAVIDAVRKAIHSIEPNLPLFRVTTLEQNIENTVDMQRAGAAMLGVFGGLGLLLAALGLFGVISQGVASRTREIGIRMSLGARAIDVVRSFVREGVTLTAVGTIVGVLISVAISRMLRTLLFGLTPTDAFTFALATGVLALVALGASFIPARRAAKVDPMIALRSE